MEEKQALWRKRGLRQEKSALWRGQRIGWWGAAHVAERCACGLFAVRPDGHVCRGVRCSVKVCVRTGMTWSSDSLVWLLASPLPSFMGCGSWAPKSLICSPACQGVCGTSLSLERTAAHRTLSEGQRRRHGGRAAGQERAQGVGAARGGGRGWGTWVRRDLGAPRGCTILGDLA